MCDFTKNDNASDTGSSEEISMCMERKSKCGSMCGKNKNFLQNSEEAETLWAD